MFLSRSSSIHYFYPFARHFPHSLTVLPAALSFTRLSLLHILGFVILIKTQAHIHSLSCLFHFFFHFVPMATAKQPSYHAFEEIAPPSTSASRNVPCEVFINHRGPDTKETLASSIYNVLHGMGVQVFLDKEVLDLGDVIPSEIEEAMRSSFLHIAILSPKYAESPWCLAELSFMLKTGSTIIPVFYNVEHSDVRYVKGPFAAAFADYEMKKRYSSEKLDEWKSALNKVSFHFGEILKDNKDEERLLKSIVNCVMKHMKKKVQLEVAKHPVGLDEAIDDFESVLDSSQKIQIVGIVGIGGSGKTTLAREIYNRKSSFINKSSFLFDVRDAANKNELYKRQKKLMQDIGDDKSQFDDVEEGREILKRRLRSLQVFFILDDVDNSKQLDALLPGIESFGQGSLIIVTSREMGVLKSWGISTIYQVKGLNLGHARELLCWHAFLQSSPPDEFQDLVEKFLQFCNGLPLSLEVFGGLLYKESKDHWESQLKKALRLLPSDIMGSLKISFNALDREEQEVFLDIACFFIGEEKNLAIAVWEGSGWEGVHSWKVLENKCLVEVDESNQIKMHDHLRDLGREIAMERPPYRVWSTQQITEIQKQATERVLIRGIKAATDDFYEEDSSYQSTPFEECIELLRGSTARSKRLAPSILVVKDNYFTEELATLFPGLLWLRWLNFGESSLPSWLLWKNLRVLELPGAEFLQELWSDTADPPSELRELNLYEALSFRRFPRSIGRLKHLKKISVYSSSGCPMDCLPEGFCLLQSLEHLQLKFCNKLLSLPSDFGLLTNLRYLDLTFCWELRMLPASFKQLRHLQYINFQYCNKLTLTSENNDILQNMTKLETLDFESCSEIQELPLHITNQLSLRYLNVACGSSRELPSNIGQLSKLEVLKIWCSESLASLEILPESIVNLSSLTNLVINCPKLKSLPETLGHLCCLTSLSIFCAYELRTLPESIGNLSFLTDLHIQRCPKLKSLPESIGHLFSLRRLHICDCKKLELESIGHLSCLTSLEISELETLPESIGNLSSLTTLRIRNCELESLPESIGHLSSLRDILLYDCTKIKTLPESIGHLSSLDRVSIVGCKNLETLPESMSHLSSLTTLTISHCRKLRSFPEPVRSLNQLEERSIKSTPEKSLSKTSAQLSNLQSLNIGACSITEIFLPGSFSSSLCKLKSIKLSVTDVSRISISEICCPSLKALKLHNNDQLVEIETLPRSVKAIELCKCKMLKGINVLSGMVNLEKLSIKDCGEKLDELPSFADLVSLKEFEITKNAKQPREIQGLENCISLERLSAVNHCKVPAIQNLEHMVARLRRLELSAACNIAAFEPCLQTIKKWPQECILWARTERGVESVVNSFAFPGLTLVDSRVEEIANRTGLYTTTELRLKCGQRRSSNAAAIVCSDISSRANIRLNSKQVRKGIEHGSEEKWVLLGVFTQRSLVKEYILKNEFRNPEYGKAFELPEDNKARGMLVMGEQERVVEGFKKLLSFFK